MYESDELIAVGLNSARALPFHGGGRLNERQVARAARLKSADGRSRSWSRIIPSTCPGPTAPNI